MRYLLIMLISGLLTACGSINLVPTQAPVLRLNEVHGLGATRVEFNDDGSKMATGGHLGEIYIWTVPEGKKLQTLKQHDKRVKGLIWVGDTALVSGSEDGQITVWDVANQKLLKTVSRAPVATLQYLPQQKHILSGHQDGNIHVWRYPDLKLLATRKMSAAIRSIAIHPNFQQLAIATDDSKVGLYDLSFKQLKTLPTADKNAQELQYSPDGKQLVAGTWFDLHYWNLKTGKLTIKDTEHAGAIISVDFSPDGKRLATLGRHTDANIRIRKIGANTFERRLRAHNLCGYHVRYSPNGRYLASASEDESIRLYDVAAPYNPTWGE